MSNIAYGIIVLVVGMLILTWVFKRKREIMGKYVTGGKINETYVATLVSQLEGRKHQVNIADIKEILKATFDILGKEYTNDDILKLIENHRKT